MKYKMQSSHVRSFQYHHTLLRRLPPPERIRNPISTIRKPWSPAISIITTTTATSPPHGQLIFRDQNPDEADTEIEQIGKNSRRIRSRIGIHASLETVWAILTDYETLAEFIPGLAVSRLLEKTDTYARLFQIGQQKLAFGINFNAKGIVDCYEKDLETLPFGQRRDIEFKMIEGDFQLFEGKWSIEQYNIEGYEDDNSLTAREHHSTLSYVVDVEPKLWLPVGLVEGRLCKEIKLNLSCIREEAQRRS